MYISFNLQKQREPNSCSPMHRLLHDIISPAIVKILSTLAEDAGILKYFFANGAIRYNIFS
jgi:hypothetical protein